MKILSRSEMKNILGGSDPTVEPIGQQCNCIYCYDGIDQAMQTYPVSNCTYDPNIFCQSRLWDSGNYGLC